MTHTPVSPFVDFHLSSHTVSLHAHRSNSAHLVRRGAAAVGVLVCVCVKISSAPGGNNSWAGVICF